MYREIQREPNIQCFEIYEYDNEKREFSASSIGFGKGRDQHEACQNFARESGWTAGNGNKSLWAKYPICS